MQDPYGVLGLSRDSSPAEITAAYRELVMALHPDARRASADPDRLAEVVAAYSVLRDAKRRAAHEATRAEPPPVAIPVRVVRPQPDIRVGPTRRHLR
ncbi:DnaJ domain-containing protein [Allokutzneria albata]|uniref:DnaJ domain-containing protein n=1 Tax=Allokutzneria albata TaxID=211114 RepID=A0A1G9T3B5_ALLAB|nr:DnaJ domain-containing protein [Allokutzneria albata]